MLTLALYSTQIHPRVHESLFCHQSIATLLKPPESAPFSSQLPLSSSRLGGMLEKNQKKDTVDGGGIASLLGQLKANCGVV